uniref:Putative secreted protein n=1 Tax=Anopheles triannulatus TaxID=58253 RepID=A0A2M4B6R8_9DIPT
MCRLNQLMLLMLLPSSLSPRRSRKEFTIFGRFREAINMQIIAADYVASRRVAVWRPQQRNLTIPIDCTRSGCSSETFRKS